MVQVKAGSSFLSTEAKSNFAATAQQSRSGRSLSTAIVALKSSLSLSDFDLS